MKILSLVCFYKTRRKLQATKTAKIGLARGDGDEVVVEGNCLMQPLPGLVQGIDAVSDTQTVATVLLHSSV